MHEDELRAIVREAVARHLRTASEPRPDIPLAPTRHPSHFLLPLPAADDDPSCLIEPDVRCSHCNYCKSYGH